MSSTHASIEIETGKVVGPQLYVALRDRILRGALAPGMRLSEAEVAVAYGVSRQPVRETFIRLAAASLIEIRPQRGSYVTRIEVAAVLSAQFVREAVEADIARAAARLASPESLDALDALVQAQEEVVALDDPQPFILRDEAFHRRLAEIAGQGGGWDHLQPLKTQMDRVRHLSARSFPRPALVSQHRAIVAALRDGDADLAERHMRSHLRGILADLPAVVAALPDFFRNDAP